MKRLASLLLVSTGLLVLILTFSASNPQAVSTPSMSSAAELSATTAVEDHVVLERRFDSTRSPCTGLGVPTNRVFPDGTRESFVVPAGKAFVLTDLEGEIAEKTSAVWFVGTIGTLTATSPEPSRISTCAHGLRSTPTR